MDGITYDLNRVNRAYFRDWWKRLLEAGRLEDIAERGQASDHLTGELVEKIVTTWPYEQPISREGYVNLGLLEVEQVDAALQEALALIMKKK